MRIAAIVGTLSLIWTAACGGGNASDVDGGRPTDAWRPSEDAFVMDTGVVDADTPDVGTPDVGTPDADAPDADACDGAPCADAGECTVDGPTAASCAACDGVDNDCDGAIDEGCGCMHGLTVACGPPESLTSTGACRPGTQTCDCSWGACIDAIVPAAETCDGTDEDCDGSVDEGVCP